MCKIAILLIALLLPASSFSQNENWFIATKDGKQGIIDIISGETILPFRYTKIINNHEYFTVIEEVYDQTLLHPLTLKNLIPEGYKYASGYGHGNENILIKDIHTGKYGAINTEGKTLLPCIYNKIIRETAGVDTYRLTTDTNCVILDGSFNYKMSCKEYDTGDQAYTVIKRKVNEDKDHPKYQYAAKNKQTGEVVTPWFDCFIKPYNNKYFDLYYLMENGSPHNLGICSLTGEILAPPEHSYISKWHNSPCVALRKDNKSAFLNTHTGKMITPYIYDNTPEPFKDMRYPDYIAVKRGGKFGVLDLNTGEEIIPCIYSKVRFHSWTGGYMLYKDNKVGMFDCEQGILAVPCEYEHFGINYLGESYVYVIINADKCGVINKEGEEILPMIYDNIFNQDGNLVLSKDSTLVMYDPINRKEKESFRIGKNLYPFSDRFIIVKEDDEGEGEGEGNKVGIANSRTGELILPCQYAYIEWIDESYCYTYHAETNAANIFSADTGKELIDIEASQVSWDYGNLISFEQDNKYGVYNLHTRQIIIPNIYDYIWIYREDAFITQLDGNYGVINNEGKTLIPFIYEELTPLHEYVAD